MTSVYLSWKSWNQHLAAKVMGAASVAKITPATGIIHRGNGVCHICRAVSMKEKLLDKEKRTSQANKKRTSSANTILLGNSRLGKEV